MRLILWERKARARGQLPRPLPPGQPAWRDIGHADAEQLGARLSPHAGRGSRRSVNAFLTINRAKIAEWSLSIVSRVKRGDYPWTPVRCLTFETGVLRPPRRRLAPAAGIRGGKRQRWSISRQVRAGRPEADFLV